MSEKIHGSLEGSKSVTKQSTGNNWCVDPDSHERGDGNNARGSSTNLHGQKKAKYIKPLNEGK